MKSMSEVTRSLCMIETIKKKILMIWYEKHQSQRCDRRNTRQGLELSLQLITGVKYSEW